MQSWQRREAFFLFSGDGVWKMCLLRRKKTRQGKKEKPDKNERNSPHPIWQTSRHLEVLLTLPMRRTRRMVLRCLHRFRCHFLPCCAGSGVGLWPRPVTTMPTTWWVSGVVVIVVLLLPMLPFLCACGWLSDVWVRSLMSLRLFLLCYCRRSVWANKKILVTVERLGECCAIFEYRTPCPFYVAANAVFIQFELFALSLPLVMLSEICFQRLLWTEIGFVNRPE